MQFKSLSLFYQPYHISHIAMTGMPFFVEPDKAVNGTKDIYLYKFKPNVFLTMKALLHNLIDYLY